MNEMTACGRNDWPPITMVIFRNYQWGAEKRNTTLWYRRQLRRHRAQCRRRVRQGCRGLRRQGRQGRHHGDADRGDCKTAIKEQMEDNVTTFIEVVLNQELGEPFRRDAMKTPVAVAGIDPDDMRPQPLL